MDWSAITEFINPATVISSVLFGLMIGALYGYELTPVAKTRFPWTLWSIGLGFVALVTIALAFNPESSQNIWAFGFGRAVLWTVLCLAIPVGRLIRQKVGR